MADIYLHGIETIEQNAGPRPVATIDTGIIGLIGTAPAADATLWPLNTPIPIFGYNGLPAGLGTTGTIPDAIEGILDQAGRASQTIIVIRVTEGAALPETIGNLVGSAIAKTGVHAFRRAKSELNLRPKLLVAPGFTSQRPTNGIASITVGTAGTGYDQANPPIVTITRGVGDTTGVGANARAVVSPAGAVTEVIIENPGTGYTAMPTVAIAAPTSGTTATATATLGTVANPVAIELVAIAKMLRACAILDAPSTTAAAAITYRGDFNTDRALIVDNFVKIQKGANIVSEPPSARIAGLQARIDYEEGFWFSPSNHVVDGIIGVARPIEHSLFDRSVESQALNAQDIAVVIRAESGGYRLWGSRVPFADALRKFWSVRRAHDTIIESIELAHEPFIDKPFSKQILVDIAETVNAALRRWAALGATLGGRVWLDPTLNTAQSMASGILYVHYDAEAPAPIEHLVFMFNRNVGYYTELSERAAREVARLSLAAA